MRRSLAIAMGILGVTLVATPALVHSHSSHGGHLGFGLSDEPPEDGHAIVLSEGDVESSVMECIRTELRTENPWSPVVHAEDVDTPLERALTGSDEPVYLRVDSRP